MTIESKEATEDFTTSALPDDFLVVVDHDEKKKQRPRTSEITESTTGFISIDASGHLSIGGKKQGSSHLSTSDDLRSDDFSVSETPREEEKPSFNTRRSLGDAASVSISSYNKIAGDELRQPLHRNRNKDAGLSLGIAPHARRKNSMRDISVHKLRLSTLGLHGRESELKVLEACWRRLLSDPGKAARELLLVSGYSGTGKTQLVSTLRPKAEAEHGIYASGKFDCPTKSARKIPYSGIARACAEICGSIVRLQIEDPEAHETVSNILREELGSELGLLIRIVPALGELLLCTSDDEDCFGTTAASEDPAGEGSSSPSENIQNQLRFAFQRYFGVVCRLLNPVVVVLDDLQWADTFSLDLLEALVTDRTNNSQLMVVGVYRSNEVDDATHPIQRTLESLASKSNSPFEEENKTDDSSVGYNFYLSTLSIGNLQLGAIHKIIAELLSSDADARTLNLAELCLSKTQGNAFFLIHFLKMLHEMRLLEFNFGTMSWVWNEAEIESKTSATDNVLDLLARKMRDLPEELIVVLKIASQLGSIFEFRVLMMAWKEIVVKMPCHWKVTETRLRELLAELIEGNYILKPSEQCDQYIWEHDKIQEAVLSMMCTEEKAEFGHRVGNILLKGLDEDELDASIFVVVKLLDCPGFEDRVQLAELNRHASRKAISLSAYTSAVTYTRKGIELLPDNCWEVHYRLALQLHILGAIAEGFMGNLEVMQGYCTSIIDRKDIPFEDKFDVYIVYAKNLLYQGNPTESRDIILHFLRKCNYRFPTNRILVAFGALKSVLKMASPAKSCDVMLLKRMDNTTSQKVMKMLDLLISCFFLQPDLRIAMVVYRSLELTLKDGYCDYSPLFFAWTGVIVSSVLNDKQSASLIGEKAIKLLDRIQNSQNGWTITKTLALVNAVVFPWTKPLRTVVKPLLRGYDIGMQKGDVENAMFCILTWMNMRFLLGVPLDLLAKDMLLYANQMQDMRKELALLIAKYTNQVFLNLLGKDNVDDPTLMTGLSLSKEDHNKIWGSTLKHMFVAFRGILLTVFAKHVLLAEQTLDLGHGFVGRLSPADPINTLDTHLKALSCYAAFRETGKRKYLRIAKICRQKQKRWIQQGNPNLQHQAVLLDAEDLARKGTHRSASALENYQKAVLLSARSGFQFDAALACERLAAFHLQIQTDRREASFQLQEAIKYYQGWGAMAKVKALQRDHAELLLFEG